MVDETAPETNRSRYFIALLPNDDDLTFELREMMKSTCRECENPSALSSPPHFTIQKPFTFPDNQKNELYATLEEQTRTWRPFRIDLSGFGTFQGSNVIFIKASEESANWIKKLSASLKWHLKNNLHLRPRDLTHNVSPHITLAKQVKKETLDEVYAGLEDMPFENGWTLDRLCLMRAVGRKRAEDPFEQEPRWVVDKEFVFKCQRYHGKKGKTAAQSATQYVSPQARVEDRYVGYRGFGPPTTVRVRGEKGPGW
ncbi:2'-5' RNA ligase [Carpediemonas membranifera]|uniref:2'-5' RNA ligase n=1 Tax=Carpediemonas membranifera TaxID=201153 RepID=A0A8J6BG53_9EUKA|nr:2'-5' RNA ligase [Carpediemonas membranifera]|eukprot:KAG9396792.1 2'-5' RNA ligase [Carpediemonas membranifera]